MKHFKLVVALILSAALWASLAYAGGTWSQVKVTQIKVCTSQACPPSGRVIVQLSASVTGGTPPACSSSYRNYVVIDTSTPAGAFAAAVMQSARLSGMPINVEATGSCNVDPAVETLASVTN